MLGLKLAHVSETGPRCLWSKPDRYEVFKIPTINNEPVPMGTLWRSWNVIPWASSTWKQIYRQINFQCGRNIYLPGLCIYLVNIYQSKSCFHLWYKVFIFPVHHAYFYSFRWVLSLNPSNIHVTHNGKVCRFVTVPPQRILVRSLERQIIGYLTACSVVWWGVIQQYFIMWQFWWSIRLKPLPEVVFNYCQLDRHGQILVKPGITIR